MNRPFPGPYHSDGKLINDRAGVLIAQVMGNSGVPAVSMTAALLAAAWDMHEELTNLLLCSEYETPGGGRNCRFCDEPINEHAENCVIHGVLAVLAKAGGRAS